VASNGRLPASALARIPGNGWLRKDAARAYIAMALVIRRKRGVDMAIYEGAMRRTYRPFAAQQSARSYWCSRGRCGNAAVPGTSNHGWGLSVDLMSLAQRRAVDALGAPFGWAKRWSDAAHEWWHLKWRAGVWSPPKPQGPRTLKPGASGAWVKRLQRILRAKGFKSVPAPGKAGYGYYGRTTRSAVRRVQRKRGIKPDAVVGPQTWRALGVR
jgi:hypothetical protein